jgi:hypothetical protein
VRRKLDLADVGPFTCQLCRPLPLLALTNPNAVPDPWAPIFPARHTHTYTYTHTHTHLPCLILTGLLVLLYMQKLFLLTNWGQIRRSYSR